MTATAAVRLDAADPGERRRWPLRPLLDACGVTTGGLALELGIARDVVTAAGRRGLSDEQADEWAIALGFHPVLVSGWAWVAGPSAGSSHARVAHHLRLAIERADYAPGELLPAAKVLAAAYGVGTNTVTRATEELHRAGVLTGGGRGQRLRVALSSVGSGRDCVECGQAIAAGAEHYPHRADCTRQIAGWCDCDHPTHPGCCPTCAGEARP